MKPEQLFPREPKRLRQPSKAVLRQQLRLAADRIIEQGAEIDRLTNGANGKDNPPPPPFPPARIQHFTMFGPIHFSSMAEFEEWKRLPWWKRINWRKVG